MGIDSGYGIGSLKTGVCTSTTRPASPFDGQTISETDTDSLQVYKGSAWGQVSGLVLISSTTIGTGVSSVTVSNAFSATYDNYIVSLSGGVASADANLRITLGSTATGYYYSGFYVPYTVATLTAVSSLGSGTFIDMGYGSTNALSSKCEIDSPFLTKRTVFRSTAVSTSATYPAASFGGYLNDATSYTAFTITSSGATLTGGTIRVYGYSNS